MDPNLFGITWKDLKRGCLWYTIVILVIGIGFGALIYQIASWAFSR